MSFTVSSLLLSMGLVPKAIFLLLSVMALVAIYLAAERWFTFYRMGKQSHQFAIVVADLLKEQRFQETLEKAGDRAYQYSYLARLIAMGLREFEGLRVLSRRIDPADLLQRALDRAMFAEALSMRRGLSLLATIGTTAPYVGLFGTLVGVSYAFDGLARSEAAGYSAIFPGLAQAILFTAMGLLVSIPSIWAFNYLVDRIERLEIQMNNSAAEIIDYCLRQIGAARGQTNTNI